VPTPDSWADRLGDRAFEMLWSRGWVSISWAAIEAGIGAFLGVFPTGLPFLTWLVGCAGIGFIAWWAFGLVVISVDSSGVMPRRAW